MLVWGQKKRCVEQLARERNLTCRECGSSTLAAKEAEWSFGEVYGGELDVYLEYSNCRTENLLTLPPEEYRRCGFDSAEGLLDM
jgi:hypothetical protein